jgi:hypothetical protein
MPQSSRLSFALRKPTSRMGRWALGAMLLAFAAALTTRAAAEKQRATHTATGLHSAAERFAALTDRVPAEGHSRAAIAWGYAERLRLGLESPFRLIDAAGRDPRLTYDDRRTVSWALLARVLSGETHEIEAAALDHLGPWENGQSAAGEQHLLLITRSVSGAEDPRAGELAVRLAYTLASAERLVDGSAVLLAAEAAAMIADRELARREAKALVRSGRRTDPIEVVRERRGRRAFYVERPVLLAPSEEVELSAIALVAPLLDSLRSMRVPAAGIAASFDSISNTDEGPVPFSPELFAAGARVPPVAALAVTVQRYLPLVRSHLPRIGDAVKRARNAEMLVAAVSVEGNRTRSQRRALGRLMLAAAVSMRSTAQEPVWFAGDSGVTAMQLVAALGLADISFDAEVPVAWQPYFLRSFAEGVRDVRRVLPTLRLTGVRVRFRMTAPADSALAMHDPRTRTLHLPVPTAGGALLHELAHDLDRQSASRRGVAGYRSDIEAQTRGRPGSSSSGRVAASLRALTDEQTVPSRGPRPRADRPAEIFATRVDWFVAGALARQGISSGFLSAVQDETLTGHVVHAERLRSANLSRSLLAALEGMTTVAPLAASYEEPGAQTLLRWALAGPFDRRTALDLVRGGERAWGPTSLLARRTCLSGVSGRPALVRMAAESRARGWLRGRLRRPLAPEARGAWNAGENSDSTATAERQVAVLRDYLILGLATDGVLASPLAAQSAPIAARAGCIA